VDNVSKCPDSEIRNHHLTFFCLIANKALPVLTGSIVGFFSYSSPCHLENTVATELETT
jgi:nitrate reductase NapE component